LDKGTGKEVWSYDTRIDGGPRSFHGDPLLYKGTLFISTDRGGCAEGGYVYAFEQQTGKLRWKYRSSGPSTGFAQINSSIVFGTREDEWISAAMNSGKANWTFRDTAPDPHCEIRTTPVTDGRGVYFVTHDGAIIALNFSGHKIWTQKPSSTVTTSLFVNKNMLYFGANDRHIYGINPADGSPLVALETPAILKGRFAWSHKGKQDAEYIFAVDKKDGHDQGILVAFSGKSERVLWASPSEREWMSDQPHVWRDWIIAGNCKGDVAAYRANDGKPAWTDHVKGCIRSFGHDASTLYIGVQEGTVYAYQPSKLVH
jgi:outer membrane protein assembly factor BamB